MFPLIENVYNYYYNEISLSGISRKWNEIPPLYKEEVLILLQAQKSLFSYQEFFLILKTKLFQIFHFKISQL